MLKTPTLLATSLLVLLTAADGLAKAPPPLRVDRSLSLQQALRLAARRNLGLLRNDLERRRVALGYDAAWQTFLPELSMDTSYQTLPKTDVTGGGRNLSYGASVTWKAPVGTSLELGMRVDPHVLRGDASHRSSLNLTAKQPLLRGGWRAGAGNTLAEAQLEVGIQRALFHQQLETLLANVVNAYWGLAFAELDVANRTRTRNRAKRQYLDTKENIRRGIIAKIEIFVVEDNLVFFEQQLLAAKQSLVLARRALAQLLQVAGNSKISVSDDLSKLPKALPSRKALLSRGLHDNPTLLAEILRVRKNRVQLSFQRNQALPSLDLAGSLKLNGVDKSYRDHLAQVATGDRPEATIGLTLTLPLSWRANRAKVSQAKLALTRQLLAVKRQEATVRYRLGDVATRMGFEERRLRLAERRLALSKNKLAAEVQKYKNGISTLDVIVRFQREFDQAVLNVRRAQLSLRRSWAEVHQLLGAQHRRAGIRMVGKRS